MAITKILYMRDCGRSNPGKHLRQAIDYITVPEKCGGGKLVSAVNCLPDYAYDQMIKTKRHFNKTDKRQGYHIIISFEENEVTPDKAFEIIREFTEEYLGSKGYEAIYSVHDNTAHVHGHIVFNSVNCLNGKKYRYEKGDWAKYIQPITNRLCEKHGLSTITIEEDTALAHDSYTEWKDNKDKRFSWSDMIRRDLDACIIQACNYEEFLTMLADKGYEIKQNKYPAVRPPGMGRYRRCRYFGEDYTEDRIKERILSEDMEYYRNTHAKAGILKVTVPYHIRRAKLSGLQKKYFERLYRVGRLKQRPYSQVWKYRDEIKRMHRLHDEYMFLSDYEIHTVEDMQRVCGMLEKKKASAENERRRFFSERARFKPLFALSDRLASLYCAEITYQNGDNYFTEEHEEYSRLVNELKDMGYTPDEVAGLRESLSARSEVVRSNYIEARKEYRIAMRLLNEQTDDDRSIDSINNEQISRKSRD